MKTIFNTFLIVIIFQTFAIGQNSFFHKGAQWIITNENNCGIGYQVLDYMGDTIIHGHELQIIRSHYLNYVYKHSENRESKSWNIYYIQRENQLWTANKKKENLDTKKWQKLIFDLDVNEGDTIVHRLKPDQNIRINSPFQYTIIDSIKTITINNTPLKTWYGTLQCGIYDSKITSVIFNERIGEISHPFKFFIWKCRENKKKIPELIYYSDHSGFKYDPFDEYKSYKEMKDNVENPKYFYEDGLIENLQNKIDLIKLFPNPAKTKITLQLKKEIELENLAFEIHAMDCKSMMKTGSINTDIQEIDISNLASGNYIFLLKQNGRFLDVESFVVQQ